MLLRRLVSCIHRNANRFVDCTQHIFTNIRENQIVHSTHSLLNLCGICTKVKCPYELTTKMICHKFSWFFSILNLGESLLDKWKLYLKTKTKWINVQISLFEFRANAWDYIWQRYEQIIINKSTAERRTIRIVVKTECKCSPHKFIETRLQFQIEYLYQSIKYGQFAVIVMHISNKIHSLWMANNNACLKTVFLTSEYNIRN